MALTEDDLFDIQEKLWDARSKWKNIGLAIKIRNPDLDVIEQNNHDIDAKFRSMILHWLKNGKDCTWVTLCKALEARSVGLDDLAARIRSGRCADEDAVRRDARPPKTAPVSAPRDDVSVSVGSSTTFQGEASPLGPPDFSPGAQFETAHRGVGGTANTAASQDMSPTPKGAAYATADIPANPKGNQANTADPFFDAECMTLERQATCASPTQTTTPPLEPPLESQHSLTAQTEFIARSENKTGAVPESELSIPVAVTSLAKVCQTEMIHSEESQTASSKELSLHTSLKLREYQEELAVPGLQGKNYIFVAPTGTGKTLVAGYIIMHHLNKMLREGRKGKVAFITPTRQLTFQQKTKLQEYVPGIRVVEITGASGRPMHPLVQSDEADVIVCTAGKLRRELKTKDMTITDLSLIVADECHHAGRPSNYSDIMEFYIRSKLAQPASALLPQVVGLTASPGAGRGKSNIVTVMEHQLSLCATMDATTGILSVGRNVAELESVRKAPKSYLEVTDERNPNDPFILHVHSTMEPLEEYIGNAPCLVRGSSKYDSWLQNEKEAAENREKDEKERISVLDQLNVYSQCLMTYHDFRHEDAVSVLEEVEEFTDATPFEKHLFKNHSELLETLSHMPKTPNPLLVHMESVLLGQFTRCPQSKGIFFVRAVKHTRYVTNWIKSSPILSCIIRATPITGYSRGGMEKSEQLQVLEGFHRGKYNLLASTSVLEEGLDVPECNFVIRYQNVSNEIAQVQAKGRARAQDSRIYTVVSSDSNKDYWYLVQEEKQRLVEASLSTLKDMPLHQVIAPKQKSFIQERDRIAQQQRYLRGKWPYTERVEVLCKKCKVLACKGSDVFAYTLSGDDNPHHVVPSEAFSNKYEKREHDKPVASYDFVKPYRIFCRSPNCRSQWGVIAVWGDTGYKFPVLKCESFLYKYGESTRRFKKWKDIWFEVQSIQDWAEFEDDVTQ